MKKLKVLTVVGTRPEIIRLSRVMAKLDASPAIEHITVHTGQNYDYELNQIFYDDLEIRKPDYYLDAAGKNAAETIGNAISKIDPILEKEKPDAFLVLGDTNSCLCAIPAKRRHIPIFHMEAGNRCFDQRVPEETNRKIVDHIADINLPYSSIAREYLLREGIPPDRIIKTGSPMFEVLHYYMPKIEKSEILNKLGLEKEKYFLVSAHREENIDNDKNLFSLLISLNLIAEEYKLPIIVSTHPRTRKRLQTIHQSSPTTQNTSPTPHQSPVTSHQSPVTSHPLITFADPFGFCDYVKLEMNSFAVLSDSGTISEETSILNLRALNIREAHERPEAMEEASVMMVGLNPIRIIHGLAQLQQQKIGNERNLRPVADYSIPNVSDKVVRIILSYTDYVKRVVWGERIDN
ncbi:MAG: UDP-N-acetyl-L-fucosamine synthase [Epulopiscium sp.]|nr:UDP-N-acetyl-L-fucosamine synthase [Candidatus Epulonipiscium sp.]